MSVTIWRHRHPANPTVRRAPSCPRSFICNDKYSGLHVSPSALLLAAYSHIMLPLTGSSYFGHQQLTVSMCTKQRQCVWSCFQLCRQQCVIRFRTKDGNPEKQFCQSSKWFRKPCFEFKNRYNLSNSTNNRNIPFSVEKIACCTEVHQLGTGVTFENFRKALVSLSWPHRGQWCQSANFQGEKRYLLLGSVSSIRTGLNTDMSPHWRRCEGQPQRSKLPCQAQLFCRGQQLEERNFAFVIMGTTNLSHACLITSSAWTAGYLTAVHCRTMRNQLARAKVTCLPLVRLKRTTRAEWRMHTQMHLLTTIQWNGYEMIKQPVRLFTWITWHKWREHLYVYENKVTPEIDFVRV